MFRGLDNLLSLVDYFNVLLLFKDRKLLLFVIIAVHSLTYHQIMHLLNGL